MSLPPTHQDCFWTLVIQCNAQFGTTWKDLPSDISLTECGEFVSKNQITIPIAHNIDAKILVAKSMLNISFA